jgi:predicted phage terminase large subunit-like protein
MTALAQPLAASLVDMAKAMLRQTVVENQWIPQQPTVKQAVFLALPNLEAFYGGAAGGGKSSALLMAALQFVDTPGYAALILRRTYADLALPGALMDRAQQWLGITAARWSGQEHTWTFPSGATVTFGYCENASDIYRYQGSEFQTICFDELTQFTEAQYRYLFSRARRLQGVNLPLRIRAASNPGGVGHDWVKQRFLIEGKEAGRVFIPASLPDNPHLDQGEYRRSLSVLDPITRAQLLDGNWTARQAGGLFRREWFPIVDAVPADLRPVRFWDLAATEANKGDPDYTAGALVGMKDGRYYILDMRRMRGTPAQVEALLRQTAELDGRAVPIHIEQEGGASGKIALDVFQRRVLVGWAVYAQTVTKKKVERAAPVSSAAEAGNVMLKRGAWIGAFLDEAEAFPQGAHDDQVDAVSGAFAQLTHSGWSRSPSA